MTTASMTKLSKRTLPVFLLAIALGSAVFGKPLPANGKLKIFIMSGQSNMIGFGQLAGSPGTMETYLKSNPKDYGHLVGKNGNVGHFVCSTDFSGPSPVSAGHNQNCWCLTVYPASGMLLT
ncbi:MAG: hypothetical protein WCK89_04895 [bacterium]